MIAYDRWLEILGSDVRMPAVVVDQGAFDRNLQKLVDLTHQMGSRKKIRLATKSIRVPGLIRRALGFHPVFQGLMTFSAEETWQLSLLGFDDFLLAYPTLQSSDLQALRTLCAAGKTVRVVVDCREHLEALSGIPVGVVIEVDASLRIAGLHLGVRRSPIRTFESFFKLVEEISRTPGIKFSGAMLYEAQIAGLGDRNPTKPLLNPIASLVRRISARKLRALREQLHRECTRRGIALEVFNGGGTGSLTTALREPWLTEVSAGSALFSPHLFDCFSNIRFEPSCFFALQAVRSSDPGLVTCQGGGYIASGEAGRDRLPIPWLPEGSRLISTEGAGEVQTPVRLAPGARVHLGDPVLFRHAKAGELMERFNEVLVVDPAGSVSREKTWRGMGMSFF